MNLVQLVDLNARKFGDKDCLRYEGQSYSFTRVKEDAEKVAGLLQSWGVKKGDRVGLMSFNTPDYVKAFYGILKAGAVVVPINHKLAAPEAEYILEHSESKAFFFDATLAEVAGKVGSGGKKVAIGGEAEGYDSLAGQLAASLPDYVPVEISDEDYAEILYTSGTTGKPKGCLHSHRNVVFAGITGALCMKMDEHDRMLMAMPIWHSSPLNNWFIGAQYVGACTVLLREYHPLHFLQAIQEEKCTIYFGAPVSYLLPLQMIPNFEEYDLSSMRCWIYGGGPISSDVALRLMESYESDNFYQVYGMTESGPTGTVLYPEEQVKKAGSIGCKALPGADILVMKNESEEAGPGETGEIWLKADCMMEGYYKDPEATREAFHQGWYKSGDVARVDEDGYLFIVDRTKDMIVSGGENVYSKEVEDALATHPDVVEAAVVGKPHEEWGEMVTAFIVIKEGSELNEDALKEHLTAHLAKYKIPREMHFVQELPHTPTGKVKKFELREQLT